MACLTVRDLPERTISSLKLLDTNICAGILRGRKEIVSRYLENAVLVTGNTQHFGRIAALRIENW